MRKTIYLVLKSPAIAVICLGVVWCSFLNCIRDGFAAETARLTRARDALRDAMASDVR